MFGSWQNYSVIIGNREVKGRTLIVQTWLLDMIYDLICHNKYGDKDICHDETIHLIALYNDYCNKLGGKRIRNESDAFFNLHGFFGEQKRFQNPNELFEEFAREKYILDVISKRKHPKNIYKINVEQDIINETGFSSNNFSSLIFLLFAYFSYISPITQKRDINIELANPILSSENFIKVLDKYSITIDDVRSSPLKRQVFYANPILNLNDEYFASNPFLLLCLFANSNYWVLRNLYKSKKKDSVKFVNAFGAFFEIYVEEILDNCASAYYYESIPEERNEKRADWYLNVDGTEFLVEQKSGLSLLGIKQNQTDIDMMKEHILKNWGEAVKQLYSTQKGRNLKNPIKIILVYEDYYKSECLDVLFQLDKTLINDRKYWLVTIREFEMLLMTCYENLDLFKEIVKEKDDSEINHLGTGRDLKQFFERHQIDKNKYLYDFNIMKQFDIVKSHW